MMSTQEVHPANASTIQSCDSPKLGVAVAAGGDCGGCAAAVTDARGGFSDYAGGCGCGCGCGGSSALCWQLRQLRQLRRLQWRLTFIEDRAFSEGLPVPSTPQGVQHPWV